jgi:hypothetical protein
MSDTAPIDIGHGLTAALRLADGLQKALGIEDGEPVGALLTHACKARGGAVVQDFIPTEPRVSAIPPWSLDCRDPITLSPSVQWTCCGLHGFVRNGKWVPA